MMNNFKDKILMHVEEEEVIEEEGVEAEEAEINRINK